MLKTQSKVPVGGKQVLNLRRQLEKGTVFANIDVILQPVIEKLLLRRPQDVKAFIAKVGK